MKNLHWKTVHRTFQTYPHVSIPDVHIILEQGRIALDKLRHHSGAGPKVGVEVVEIVEVHIVHALTNERRECLEYY